MDIKFFLKVILSEALITPVNESPTYTVLLQNQLISFILKESVLLRQFEHGTTSGKRILWIDG